jgi:hypothetical protein
MASVNRQQQRTTMQCERSAHRLSRHWRAPYVAVPE